MEYKNLLLSSDWNFCSVFLCNSCPSHKQRFHDTQSINFFFFVRNGTYICDVGIQFYKQFRHISVFQEGLFRTRLLFARVSTRRVGRDILVGIATRYWLDGPGVESRGGQDFPHPALGPTQPPVQRVPALSPVVKRPMQRRG